MFSQNQKTVFYNGAYSRTMNYNVLSNITPYVYAGGGMGAGMGGGGGGGGGGASMPGLFGDDASSKSSASSSAFEGKREAVYASAIESIQIDSEMRVEMRVSGKAQSRRWFEMFSKP